MQEPQKQSPLGLPDGSVRALLSLLIIATTCFFYVMDKPVPTTLELWAGGVILLYFGQKGVAAVFDVIKQPTGSTGPDLSYRLQNVAERTGWLEAERMRLQDEIDVLRSLNAGTPGASGSVDDRRDESAAQMPTALAGQPLSPSSTAGDPPAPTIGTPFS